MKRLLPVHYIFPGSRARSLLGEPVYVRNFEQKLELFTYKATSTMAPRFPITPISTITRAWHKNSSHTSDTTTPKCILRECLVLTLSNDPGEVDSSLFCYAATVLSPHRNVLIFTQRMHKPT